MVKVSLIMDTCQIVLTEGVIVFMGDVWGKDSREFGIYWSSLQLSSTFAFLLPCYSITGTRLFVSCAPSVDEALIVTPLTHFYFSYRYISNSTFLLRRRSSLYQSLLTLSS